MANGEGWTPSDVILTFSLTVGGALVATLAALWFKYRRDRRNDGDGQP